MSGLLEGRRMKSEGWAQESKENEGRLLSGEEE